MPYFKQDKIHEIHETAVGLDLTKKREDLLAGLSLAFITELEDAKSPSGQLLRDLNRLNRTDPINGEIPLELWLRNAAYAASFSSEKKAYFRGLAEQVAARQQIREDNPARQLREAETIPERILFTSDMVAFGFLKGAELVGRGTARLMVSQFENGEPRTYTSGKPVIASGTGWLIGARHVITNHHVVCARGRGEPRPADPDIDLQARRTVVQFDYDAEGMEGTAFAVKSLCAANEKLDYAIMELAEESKRSSLPLWTGHLALPPGSQVPVNIIQHPNGAPKQMAMRNNLAVLLNDRDLAYFTDTDEGSSGSAVCNDDWKVLALHKSSDPTLGTFHYQGKTTAWINTGTRIDLIIDDLKQHHAACWAEIDETRRA
jgi:endonuclease G, mitochondrial